MEASYLVYPFIGANITLIHIFNMILFPPSQREKDHQIILKQLKAIAKTQPKIAWQIGLPRIGL